MLFDYFRIRCFSSDKNLIHSPSCCKSMVGEKSSIQSIRNRWLYVCLSFQITFLRSTSLDSFENYAKMWKLSMTLCYVEARFCGQRHSYDAVRSDNIRILPLDHLHYRPAQHTAREIFSCGPRELSCRKCCKSPTSDNYLSFQNFFHTMTK